MDTKHIFNKETDSEMLARDIVAFLRKWGMWQDVQIFTGGKCYTDDCGKVVVRMEEHPERYLSGISEYDCEGHAVLKEYSNHERLLDMTFEGPLSLLLQNHEYEINTGNVSEEVRKMILLLNDEVEDEVTDKVCDFLDGRMEWDPMEYDSYEEWEELNGFKYMDEAIVTTDDIKTNPLEISTQEEYEDFMDKYVMTREQKIWDYFEDYVCDSKENDNLMFFDDGEIAGMVLREFSELLEKYGLWYELGFSWSLTTYRRKL